MTSPPATTAPTAPVPTPTRAPVPSPGPTTPTAQPPLPVETPADPLSPKPPLESPPAPGQAVCAPATLTVTDADTTYGADSVKELFTVRTSGPDCQLPGTYPQVAVLDATGAAMAPVRDGGFDLPAPTGAPVTLSGGTSLSFFVATNRDGDCLPAATLTVTFPGTTTALRTATRLQVCAGVLAVGPVQRLGDDE
ncbi:MAG TPA: hypothetical protein VFR07_03160 [Mycobacteriales bacterium]|nr:hypothetical protein [Mycobacteriales bacterium]